MNKKDDTQARQTKETIHRPDWNWWDMVFFVLPIILFVLIPLGGAFYLCGRFSPHSIYLILLMLPAYWGFTIICLIVCTVRLSRDWRNCTGKKKVLLVGEVTIPLALVASFVVSSIEPNISWPSSRFFMYGFGDRITIGADFDAVRDWLQTLDKKDLSEYGESLSPDEWPESLRELSPSGVLLSADKHGDPRVRVVWGGGIFSWGVTLGMKDMEIPQSDLRLH